MKPSRGHKTICLPFEGEDHYQRCLDDNYIYRHHLLVVYQSHPELFPQGFDNGFTFRGTYSSNKQDIDLKRIRTKDPVDTYQIRPSFLMPYMVGRVDEVEKALFLCRYGVPPDALAHVFGRNPMFWYRVSRAMGRPSIVGSTVKSKDALPKHLLADEKHSRLKAEKVYVPTTVARGCFLGASVVTSASADALEKGYGEFAEEAKEIAPDYHPETVCADGWQGTWDAWGRLFKTITVILCFLHSAIKIRKCRGDEALRFETLTRVWEAYRAPTKASFSQRVRRLREWAKAHLPGGSALREAVFKLCDKRDAFKRAYDYVSPFRTSNGVDRLMDHQDRLLYAMHYFHGKPESARLAVRAMAMLWNFHPYGPRLRRQDESRRSPFADLNGFEYHGNWLHNYLIASSLGGHRPLV